MGTVTMGRARAPARLLLGGASALLLLVALTAGPAGAAEEFDPEAAVDALNGVFGAHKGARAAHAKGLCAAGAFSPTEEARAFAGSELFAAGERPAVLRFSTGSGVPTATDKEKSVRGMALRFTLPSGNEMDMVMITVPVFVVRDPVDLITLLRLNAPDPATGKPADAAKLEAFVAAHPEVKGQGERVAKAGVPASYASTPYFAVHTFMFAGPGGVGGEAKPARWAFVPEGGLKSLAEAELKDGPDEFLGDELRGRAAQGRAAWEVFLQLPEPGDPLLDATVAWPEERRRVKVGRLAVTAVQGPGERGDCHEAMYDPLVLADGILPSDDPVLAVRSGAYAVSLTRRQEP